VTEYEDVLRVLKSVEERADELGRRVLSPSSVQEVHNHHHHHRDTRTTQIAVMCAVVMLVVNLIGAVWMLNELRRYDEQIAELRQRDRVHDAYIQAAYRGDKKPEGK
jgi:hypothetical protein